MLVSLFVLALAPQVPTQVASVTPPAVRAVVEAAAARNHEARPHRMRADAETEIALVQRRTSGRREIVAVQQEASTIDWISDSLVEQRITGYRSEQVGMSYATTRIYRVGWIVPLLVGDRIRLRLPSPEGVSKVEKALDPVVRPLRRLLAEPETVATVHPLARDGRRYYHYPRVDTLTERMPNGDSVEVLRIAVVRREDVPPGTSVFEGDVDVDVRTMLLVRLRGRVSIVSGYLLKVRDALSDQVRIVGFMDMWNGPERDGLRLPDVERLDIVSGGLAGETAELIRFVTRFRGQDVVERGPPSSDGVTAGPPQYFVTYAPSSQQTSFDDWLLPLGSATRIAQTQPIDDLYPDRLQPDGRPQLTFRARDQYDVFRFNKVEGFFTGLSASWYARDLAPGLGVTGTAGYAWSEETWRGYLAAGLRRDTWRTNIGFGRLLDITNDFRSPFDSGSVWFPLLWSSDGYDYVDRHVARVALERLLTPHGSYVRVEAGAMRDAETVDSRRRGLFFGPFVPNRVVDPGRYARVVATMEWNPDVQADITRERYGGSIRYELGAGDLDYQRTEAALITRYDAGHVVLIGRLYGGMLTGTPPTQQLLEIGGSNNLPGYDYKAFAGDRAWIARGTAQYALPYLRSPFPLIAGFVLPAIAPELNFGIQTGMAWATDDQARAAVRRLGDRVDEETGQPIIDPNTGEPVPVSVPTDQLRATASLGVRVLSGAVYLGFALPIDATRDTRRNLRFVFGFGRQL
ncbi:MAG TPA: hypothetical protein VL308_11335 [Gemmatimonadaceae bacterium]|nr:hypothetical protein [Gemmatimonadaceae bacterium]